MKFAVERYVEGQYIDTMLENFKSRAAAYRSAKTFQAMLGRKGTKFIVVVQKGAK